MVKTIVKTVNVTAKDIKFGQESSSSCQIYLTCAIARAMQRLFKNKRADWGYTHGKVGRKKWYATNPRQTKQFVNEHDGGRKVNPFRFKIQNRKLA